MGSEYCRKADHTAFVLMILTTCAVTCCEAASQAEVSHIDPQSQRREPGSEAGAWTATVTHHHRAAGGKEHSTESDQSPGSWLLRTPHYRRVTSQGQQDGALEWLFEHIGTTNKYYVEFGFNSNEHEGGTGSNTYHIKAQYGWTGLLMDGGHANKSINLHQEMITSANVVQLFEKHDVPTEPDYVSIDVDSTDLWVLRALLVSSFQPRVVSVEYNCVYGADEVTATFPDDPNMRWEGDNIHGCSLAAIDMVAREFSYSLAAVVPTLDAFLVRDDLLAGVAKPRLVDFKDTTACRSVVHGAPTRERAARLLDYQTWRATGSEAAARAALPQKLAAFGINHNRPGGRM